MLRADLVPRFSDYVASLAAAVRAAWQRQTLVKQFSLAASAVILIGMITIGTWVAERIKSGVIHSSAAASALHMDSFITPLVQELAHSQTLSTEAQLKLDTFMRQMIGRRIVSIKIWQLDGTVVYSNWRELIGRRFPITPSFRDALGGAIVAEIESKPHEGSGTDQQRSGGPLLEIYAPIHDTSSGQIIAIAEYYSIERALASELLRAAAWSWLVVGVVAFIMMSGLFGIVLTGSRTIDRQRLQLHSQIAELRSLLEQNQELRASIQRAHHRSAKINERVLRRVGADLHDGPAQLLSLALLLMHGLKSNSNDAERNHDVDKISMALADAMRDIRLLSSGLMLPEINKADLDEVVRLAVQAHTSRTGTRATCNLSLVPVAVPVSLKVCAYRFVQEALTNSFKHAGGRDLSVTATGNETSIVLKVSDQGPVLPSDAQRSHNDRLGLIGLRDRIETLGGQLAINPGPGGFSLTASFDLHETRRRDASDAEYDQHSRR